MQVRIRDFLTPVCGIEQFGSRIRYKHPGSATLVVDPDLHPFQPNVKLNYIFPRIFQYTGTVKSFKIMTPLSDNDEKDENNVNQHWCEQKYFKNPGRIGTKMQSRIPTGINT
jgi:hypothetical protein